MTFAHPGWLWLLPLALLPVILHLLGRRRRHERPFSWVRLLAEAQHEGRYRSRPLEWLILALRVLALALPILALAGARWGTLPAVRTVAVDVSGSIQGLQPRLSRVLPLLRERFPEARWVYFADRLLPRYQQTSLKTRYAVLQELGQPVLVLTDGQASGFVGLEPRPHDWIVVQIGDTLRSNVALEEALVPTPYGLPGLPLQVRVRLRNDDRRPARRVLTLRGRRPVHRQVNLPATGTVEVVESVVPGPEGRIQVSLSPEDDVPCDDHRELVVHQVQRLTLAWVGAPSVVLQALLEPQGVPHLFQVRRYHRWPSPATLQTFDGVLVNHLPPPAPGTPLATWLRQAAPRVLVLDTTGAWARFLGMQAGPMTRMQVEEEELRATPLTPGPGDRVLLRSASGRPVAVAHGSVVLLGLHPDRSGTWPLTPGFVRFFYEQALKPRQGTVVRSGVPAGTAVQVPLPPNARPPFLLQGPVETRMLTPRPVNGTPTLVAEPIHSGFYRVLAAEDTLARFTVVCPAEESDPRVAPPERWHQMPGVRVMSLRQFLKLRSVALAPWLLALALLALALEAVLLRR